MKIFLDLPAPAKINLFLHVIGKRADGYHLLQSVFQLIDLCDYIDLESNESGRIIRTGDIDWPIDSDLCVKAAKRLQRLAPHKGVSINVRKHIPHGAGLGGGSSDAATVLIGLNLMWGLGLNRVQLMEIALELGADVPFFIFGQTAFVEGIGERLSPIEVPELYFKIIFPDAHIPTRDVFRSPLLQKTSSQITATHLRKELRDFVSNPFGRNDLQMAAEGLNANIGDAVNRLRALGIPRMTGSGSAVFVATKNKSDNALEIQPKWKQWDVRSLKFHPLYDWLPH